eukprot:UN25168
MAPAWNQLMEEYANHDTILVTKVDCAGDGEPLCSDNQVQGFPTIMHGSPYSLETYEGSRSFDDLKAFAKTLKFGCDPWHPEMCTEIEKKD